MSVSGIPSFRIAVKPLARAVSLSALMLPVVALGAGYELPQRGIKEMGIAFGGSAALLEDASAVANNPAGLMRLQGQQVVGGLKVIRSGFDYDVTVNRELIPGTGGTVPGRESGSISAVSVAPHVYYSQRLADNVAIGFGIYAPFGTTTSYPNDWAGRYHATDTDITAVNFNPAFAWQATDTLSFGLGVVIQGFEGDFRNTIDLGYLVAEAVIEEIQDAEGPFGVDVRLRDGNQGAVDTLAHQFDVDNTMTVDSWGYGFNFGVLWEPSERTRIGFNYASAVRHVADGTADRPQTTDPAFQQSLEDAIASLRLQARILGIWTNVGTIGSQQPESAEEGAARAVGPLGAQGGKIQLITTFPEVATLSGYHQLLDTLAITGGVTWTNWSRVDELRFTYPDSSDRGGSDITGTGDDVRRRDLVVPFEWEDTFRYGIGAIYTGIERWALRAGISYDESPVPNAERRTPRGPDSDRLILGLGAGWQLRDNLSVDAAYTFTRLEPSDINNRENPAGSQHRIEGEYDGALHSLGVQVNYQF
ncbi:OmpP1/FadL family transporter [Isoalcanivorax indicus]|uniref:OmpP1/FadL family transporter n=1 Tax=Isoalcanivorax indicus TaxID=2202653 RepID=UPI0013C40391|nr:outer membrane protein transport protein [Isoalcanivorax indicus]